MKRNKRKMLLILILSFVMTVCFSSQFAIADLSEGAGSSSQVTTGSSAENGESKVNGNSDGTGGVVQGNGNDSVQGTETNPTGTDGEGEGESGQGVAGANSLLGESNELANEEKVPEVAEAKAIYLNGTSGSDDNDGTSADKAVATFEKAKQIATDDQNVTTIYVTGTTPISDEISLTDTNAVVKRASGMTDYLFNVVGTATLSDITIDGDNQAADESLILAANGAELIITEGTVLQNNHTNFYQGRGHDQSGGAVTVNEGSVDMTGGLIQNNTVANGDSIYGSNGGGILAQDSTVSMSGGTIEGNSASIGGGVCVDFSTMTMTGGTIRNNSAISSTQDNKEGEDYAAGGGIGAYTSSQRSTHKTTVVNLSGGTIEGNSSEEMGGGISLGHEKTFDQIVLNMTGGTISNNTSKSSGGGIFVQAGKTGRQAIANISGGKIIGNQMLGGGKEYHKFGGGGIYVNGYKGIGWANGELHLTNALITDNTAAEQGGGYASCPASQTRFYVTDGAAFYGNHASEAKELYLTAFDDGNGAGHSGNQSYTISSSMLGGTLYNWKYENGDTVPLNSLKGALYKAYGQTLRLHTDVTSDSAAQNLAKVVISGNTSATKGGGIGSNGSVFIGTPDKDTVTLHITKVWSDDEGMTRPKSVKVKVYRHTDSTDRVCIGSETISLGWEGTWEAEIVNLPKSDASGNPYVYTVEEEHIDGYAATVTGNQAEGYVITNSPSTSVSVTKTWEDNGNQYGIRPNSITVNLLADGEKVDSKTVTAADGWKCTFSDLVKKGTDGKEITYTVSEDSINNYTSKVTGSAKDGFTITNKSTYTPPTPTPTPSYTTFTVNKVWNLQAGQTAPSSVQVQLYKNGVLYDTQSVTAAQNWTYTWASLPLTENGSIINWTVQEVNPDNAYQVSILSSANSATITNTPNALSPSTTQVTVNKVWKLDNGGTAAASVQAQLYQNGAAYGDPVTLSAATNWAYTWDKLPKADASGNAYTWTVKEVNVPSGFSSSVTGEDNSFTITNDDNNTPVNPKTPDNPDNPDNPNTPNTPSTPGKSTTTTTTTVTNKTVTAKSPQTGDSSQVGLYAGLLTAAVAGAAALLIWKRRKDD